MNDPQTPRQAAFEKAFAKSYGLKVWELRLCGIMENLRHAMQRTEPPGAEWIANHFNAWREADKQAITKAALDEFWKAKHRELADELGAFIAGEIVKRNVAVLRIAADGWTNLESEKPFKPAPGKATKQWRITEAIQAHFIAKGKLPTRREIRATLKASGLEISETELSRGLSDLKLAEYLPDSRKKAIPLRRKE